MFWGLGQGLRHASWEKELRLSQAGSYFDGEVGGPKQPNGYRVLCIGFGVYALGFRVQA